jgi:hypothetical protein
MNGFTIGFGRDNEQHDHTDGVRNLPGRTGATRFGFNEAPQGLPDGANGRGVDTLAGGTLRISHGPQPGPDTYVHGPQQRVHSGATRYTAGQDGDASSASFTRHVVTDAGTAGGSILATLRREGGAATVETIPGNPASRTLVESALREGLLVRNAAGALADAEGKGDAPRTLETVQAEQQAVQVAQQQAASQAQAEADHGVFSAEEDRSFVEAMAPVPDEAYRPAVSKGIAALALGQDLDGVVRQLAESGRMEIDAAGEVVEAGRAYFQNIANRAVMQAGIPEAHLPAFYESLQGNPNLLMSALNAMATARDVSVLRKAAHEWASNNAERLVSGNG